jgi:hypothetical protein
VGGAGGTGGEGGAASDCDPPPEPGSLYALSAEAFPEFEPASMCKYRGDVLLIVNIAAV